MVESLASTAAFNQGCDARLAGKRLTANPYLGEGQPAGLANCWVRGWQDVDRHWGQEAKGEVKRLRRVF